MPFYERFIDGSREFGTYDDFNKNLKLKAPDNFNFAYDVVDEIAKQSPEKLAMVWENLAGDQKKMTFNDMSVMSSRAANALAGLGIKKGDRVMLILKRNWEFWPIMIGLHKLGAIAIPATHLLTPKDIVYRVNAAGIRAVICTNEGSICDYVDESSEQEPVELKLMIRGSREGWSDFSRLCEQSSAYFPRQTGADANTNDDIMVMFFSSGTTGMPKMAAHSYTYPLGHLITAVYWHEVEDNGLHFTISDTGWGKSLWGKLYGQWMAGCAVMTYDFDKFIPKDILKIMSKYKITSFCAPPTMYRFLLQEDFSQYDLSTMKSCTVAGEPLSPELYERWLDRTGISMREAFGQTETTVIIGTFPWMKVQPGSMGKPSPGFDVDLIDENGKSCAPGAVGEIAIRTHRGAPFGMFLGYYRDEELTQTVWHDNIYRTGDTAWRDEWGYYWFVGRVDDVIKSSGYRIGPFEVESAVLTHPAVLETAITAAPDELRGQVVKATVVLREGYTPGDELVRELQEHVKKITAPYKYPRIVEFVDELPKTISGKIRRVELRERDTQK